METYTLSYPVLFLFLPVRKEVLSERDGNFFLSKETIYSSTLLSGRKFSLKEMETSTQMELYNC